MFCPTCGTERVGATCAKCGQTFVAPSRPVAAWVFYAGLVAGFGWILANSEPAPTLAYVLLFAVLAVVWLCAWLAIYAVLGLVVAPFRK